MLLLTKQLFELSNVSRSRLVIWFPLDVMLYAFDLFKGVGNPYWFFLYFLPGGTLILLAFCKNLFFFFLYKKIRQPVRLELLLFKSELMFFPNSENFNSCMLTCIFCWACFHNTQIYRCSIFHVEIGLGSWQV